VSGIQRKWQNGPRLGGLPGFCRKNELRLFRKCSRMGSTFGQKGGTVCLNLLSSI